MRIIEAVALAACVVVTAGGCGQTPEAKAAELRSLEAARVQALKQRIAAADAEPSKQMLVAKWIVPPELREISGLALRPDGLVLTHDDEVGTVYVIDPKAGIVLKKFSLQGERHGDFEAITIAGNDIYLLESNGHIFKFREGADGAQVPYSRFDTHLGKECEFESMVFDPDSARLLLACKKVQKELAHHELVIFAFPLPLGKDTAPPTMLTVPIRDVIGSNNWKNFHASDMTIDPFTKNYVIIASREKGLVEITPDGDVVRSVPLPPGHNQPEGVAITKDSLLLISDEAHMTPAAIALYRWRP
jgi:uncharacterized protein YjiK